MNNLITYKCPICTKFPNSHSFQFTGIYKSNIIIKRLIEYNIGHLK